MSEDILTLTYDRHTGQITLSCGEERFCAAGFGVLRTRQLVLTPGEDPLWPGFLKALTEIYETDGFRIDFRGPRTALEAFRAACADAEALTVDLTYEGVPADDLHTAAYRADRLVSLYEKIDDYHCSYLNRLCFLEPLRKLVNSHLTEAPEEDLLDQIEAVLEAGQNCLEDAEDAYRAAQLRQETRQHGDPFLNNRLNEIRRLSLQMCPLSWRGMAFMNRETFLQPYLQDLQKLTDSAAEAVNGADTVSEQWSAVLQMRYCMFIRTFEAVIKQKADRFVEEINKKLQTLHGHTLWRRTAELQNYPLLEPFTAWQVPWVPEIPAEAATIEQQLACLHEYTASVLEWLYGTYYGHFIETWNVIKRMNEQNLQYFSEQTELLRELLDCSHRQGLHDRIRLDEERREIEAAEDFLEELTILLYGCADSGQS